VRKVDQAKYDEKRREILEAARACFLRDGFRGASISDICAAARMSPGHLYHYFDSKESIVKAIVELGLEQAESRFEELSSEKNIVSALVGALDRRTKKDRVQGTSFALEMMAESARNPAIAEIVRRRDRTRRELLGRLLREGQARGQVDTDLDPEIATAIVSSIIESLGYLAIRDPSFDMKRGADMLKSLMARFLDPSSAPSAVPHVNAKNLTKVARKRKLQPVS
jgi:TetR/AcrR family transcriptional regulator, repressor for uid operon